MTINPIVRIGEITCRVGGPLSRLRPFQLLIRGRYVNFAAFLRLPGAQTRSKTGFYARMMLPDRESARNDFASDPFLSPGITQIGIGEILTGSEDIWYSGRARCPNLSHGQGLQVQIGTDPIRHA